VPPLSPYKGLPPAKWMQKTRALLAQHPLASEEIVEVVLLSWDAIFESRIGPRKFRIGKHLFPKPQIMGFLLHELVTLEFSARYPGQWRGDESKYEKDLVYIPNSVFSSEIKTSSHKTQIFGNRSYAQKPADTDTGKRKEKAGYYLAVNFEALTRTQVKPRIRRIRFGWLDFDDWIGQKAATGQQARLRPESESNKLLLLYEGG
jgi:hypothetical protein